MKRRKKPGRRAAETASQRTARAARVYDTLVAAYPDARCELEHVTPFELIVATILSAQCTDKRVNMVTPALFARYPDAAALAAADPGDVEEIIRSTGFFHSKAKSLVGMAGAVMEHHGGSVPSSMEELVALRGVGRKTANVVLGNAFHVDEGVVVDTHVARLSGRLGLSKHTQPEKIELDLMELFPRPQWAMLAHLLIFHGRNVCFARKPACGRCPLSDDCPKLGVTATAENLASPN